MSVAADSTIGMTAFNLIAAYTNPMTAEELKLVAERTQHRELQLDQMERALAKLVELKRVKLDEDGCYVCAANPRLMVISRDMSDYNPTTMEGGWAGWKVRDPRLRDGVGTRPVETVLGLEVSP